MDPIKIHIGTTSDVSGIRRVDDALQQAESSADDFLNSIKAGVGIDIGGRLVSSIAAIPGIFKDAISAGVEFNMEMNNAEVGISNVLAKFMDLDQAAAKREAAKAMQQLIELEPKTAGGLSDLVQGFLATVSSAQAVGMTVAENIDLVGRFANGLANANIPAEQLSQEMRAIFSGNITPDASFAKILQITNEDVAKAKEAGTLYQLLTERIGQLGEAGDSAGVRMSSFESARDKALGKLAEPISTAFLDGIKNITEALDNGNTEELEKLGYQLAELVKHGFNFTKWATENTGVLLALGKAVGFVAAAWIAFQMTALIVGLNRKALAVFANKTAIDQETASLAANTAAQRGNAAARATGGAGGAGGGRVGRAIGAAGAGIGLGLIGYDYLSGKAAEINARTDKSKGIVDDIGNVGGQYADLIKNAASVADKQEIIKGLETDIARLRAMSAEASEEDADQIRIGTGLLDKMLATAKKLSEEKLAQKEAAAQTAAAEKDAQAASSANAEKDAKTLADRASRRQDSARDRTAAEKLDAAKSLMDQGDAAGAKASLDEQDKFFRDWMDKAKGDQGGKTGDDLKSNLDLQDQLQGYLDKIAEARQDLPAAIAKADEEAKKKQIETLQEEKELMEAAGRERLAAAGKDANLRKKIEDEIAAKRLAFENQIGALRGESALQSEARAADFRAQAIQRDNAFTAALQSQDPTSGTKSGDLFSGTKRRRGAITSDTFEQGIDITQGGRPLTNFQDALRPQGFGTAATNLVPPPALPAPGTPTPGQADPAAGQQGANPAITAAADKTAEAVKTLEDKTVTGLEKVATAVGEAGNNIGKTISKLEQRVSALEDGL